MNKDLIVCMAIGGITIIEVVALLMGHNGLLLTTTVGAICTLVGWRIPNGN